MNRWLQSMLAALPVECGVFLLQSHFLYFPFHSHFFLFMPPE